MSLYGSPLYSGPLYFERSNKQVSVQVSYEITNVGFFDARQTSSVSLVHDLINIALLGARQSSNAFISYDLSNDNVLSTKQFSSAFISYDLSSDISLSLKQFLNLFIAYALINAGTFQPLHVPKYESNAEIFAIKANIPVISVLFRQTTTLSQTTDTPVIEVIQAKTEVLRIQSE